MAWLLWVAWLLGLPCAVRCLGSVGAVRELALVPSVARLLRCGDFEHVARSFDESALVLRLPGRQRVVCVHEREVELARALCASRILADRVGAGARYPGLTRQADGAAWRSARAACNEALSGAAARDRTRRLATAAAEAELAAGPDASFGLRTARATLRTVLFGDDDATATAFLGPKALAVAGGDAVAPLLSERRGRLRVLRGQALALSERGDFFKLVDAFTNVDAKTRRARARRRPARVAPAQRAFAARYRAAAVAEARGRPVDARSPLLSTLLEEAAGLSDVDVASALDDLILAGTATTAELIHKALALDAGDDGAAGAALVQRAIERPGAARAVAPLVFRVAREAGRLGPVALEPGDGVVASLRLAPDLAFGAGKRACAGRDVALEAAAAAVDVAARHRGS